MLQLVSKRPAILERLDLKFCNLRYLELETCLSAQEVHTIRHLLKISPNIATLILYIQPGSEDIIHSGDRKKRRLKSGNVQKNREMGLPLQCKLHHLEFVEMRNFEGDVNQLKLLELLLEAASTMKKMVLYNKENHLTKRQLIIRRRKTSDKILAFPRASPSIDILVV